MIDDPVNRLTKFFYCLDTGRWDDMIALMQPGAVWHRFNGSITGHEAIRKMLGERDMTSRVCHLISSAFVDSSNQEVAAGKIMVRAYLTAYRVDGAGSHEKSVPMTSPSKIGRADTTMVKTEKGWLISEQSMLAIYNF